MKLIVIAVLVGLVACVPLHQDAEQLQPVTLAAAGDISCAPDREGTRNTCRMRDTARLVEEVQPDAVLVLGDAQYPSGSLDDFLAGYDASWGRFKAITYPVPGNHEYKTPGAAGFFSYFQLPPHSERSWYTFDLKGWRIYALDSNCDHVGGCGPGSPQYEWLTEQLESEEGKCSLAFWHHPRFSSGPHGADLRMSAFWRLLDREGVDVVLSGHDHNYERFAPMSAEGELDPQGMRQFVVGTGGAGHYPILRRRTGSEAAHSGAFGVLLLQLREDGYAWLFRSVGSGGYRDGGADRCH